MKIAKERLKQIIKEELARGGLTDLSEELERTHNGEVITPQSVAGKLSSLVDEVEALGEDFFSDSDSLAAWIKDFAAKHNIMKEEMSELTENRSIDQVVDDMEKSFGDAHRDLQTFVLSLKQSGMDFQNAEAQVKALENVILNLQKSLQAAG